MNIGYLAYSNAMATSRSGGASWPDLYTTSLSDLGVLAGFVRWTGRPITPLTIHSYTGHATLCGTPFKGPVS